MSDDEPRPDDEPRRPVGARFRRPAARPRGEDRTRRPAAPEPGAGDPPPFGLVRWGYDPVQVDARLHALGTQVAALREEVRQLRVDRAEAERAARSLRAAAVPAAQAPGTQAPGTQVPGPPAGGPADAGSHDVEDKIARVARHEAARRRVGALADAAAPRERD